MSNDKTNEQSNLDLNNISVDPFTNQPEQPESCEVDTKKPIGQYSESVRILIADMQSKDSIEINRLRAKRLLGLSRQVDSNRTRRELKLLALDLDPDCISRAYRPENKEIKPWDSNVKQKTKYEECVRLWPEATVTIELCDQLKQVISVLNPPSMQAEQFVINKIPKYEQFIEFVTQKAINITKDTYPIVANTFNWRIHEKKQILRATDSITINPDTITNFQVPLQPQQPWQAPTSTVGGSGAVRKPVAVRQMPVRSMPMGHPQAASVKQAPISRTGQPKIKDPASNVLASRQEDLVISWVAKQYSDTCFSILDKYCGFVFGKGFYPYPSNPIQEFQTDDGVLVRVLILTSATVTFNNNRHFIHYEIDGEMIKTSHPSILKNEKGIPCEYYADADRIPEGEKRCVRALRYRDGSIIRYWLHEIGGKDITEGAAYYKVRDSNIIEITFGQYIKEMHRMGKKLNIGS